MNKMNHDSLSYNSISFYSLLLALFFLLIFYFYDLLHSPFNIILEGVYAAFGGLCIVVSLVSGYSGIKRRQKNRWMAITGVVFSGLFLLYVLGLVLFVWIWAWL